jgi:hypothetical protein
VPLLDPLPDGEVLEPVVELLERLPVPGLVRSQAAREAERPMATAVMKIPLVICMMDL